MIPVREDIILHREKGTTRIDEIDARQEVVSCDLLRSQMLLHCHRVIGAALYSGIVGDDHAQATTHLTDTRDNSRRGSLAAVKILRRQGGDLEEGRAVVQERLDAITGKQLAPLEVPLPS